MAGHLSMSQVNNTARTIEKIFRRVKGVRDQMQPGEEPLLAVPAIGDSGQEQHSTPCEVIVTNQRLLGYYSVNFPRKRLFLEELSLQRSQPFHCATRHMNRSFVNCWSAK